jgi:hypothetical protein
VDHFSSKAETTAAADWRRFERQARDRLARFQAAKARGAADRVSWERMVQLLHAEGLYEDRVANSAPITRRPVKHGLRLALHSDSSAPYWWRTVRGSFHLHATPINERRSKSSC